VGAVAAIIGRERALRNEREEKREKERLERRQIKIRY
jgi:hypothetical protein